jgi:hypothetical protein
LLIGAASPAEDEAKAAASEIRLFDRYLGGKVAQTASPPATPSGP